LCRLLKLSSNRRLQRGGPYVCAPALCWRARAMVDPESCTCCSIGSQVLVYTHKYATFAPSAQPPVDILPVSETFGKSAPTYPGTVFIKHRFHEPAIIRRRTEDLNTVVSAKGHEGCFNERVHLTAPPPAFYFPSVNLSTEQSPHFVYVDLYRIKCNKFSRMCHPAI
jgi:hypothetical protein